MPLRQVLYIPTLKPLARPRFSRFWIHATKEASAPPAARCFQQVHVWYTTTRERKNKVEGRKGRLLVLSSTSFMVLSFNDTDAELVSSTGTRTRSQERTDNRQNVTLRARPGGSSPKPHGQRISPRKNHSPPRTSRTQHFAHDRQRTTNGLCAQAIMTLSTHQLSWVGGTSNITPLLASVPQPGLRICEPCLHHTTKAGTPGAGEHRLEETNPSLAFACRHHPAGERAAKRQTLLQVRTRTSKNAQKRPFVLRNIWAETTTS